MAPPGGEVPVIREVAEHVTTSADDKISPALKKVCVNAASCIHKLTTCTVDRLECPGCPQDRRARRLPLLWRRHHPGSQEDAIQCPL